MKLLTLLSALILMSGRQLHSQTSEVLRAGQTLRDVEIRLDNGKILSRANWPSNPVLIDFWASWCSNCIEAFPRLQQMPAKYGSDLKIISININEPGSRAKAQAILRKHPLPWQEASLGGGLANPVLRRFQRANQGSLPMYVLVDRNELIQYSGWGGESQSQLVSAVSSLAQKDSAKPKPDK